MGAHEERKARYVDTDKHNYYECRTFIYMHVYNYYFP